MSVTRIVAIAATWTMVSVGASLAQNTDLPAEFPPASYKGMQYVDSRGCVFIRAGIDGNTTWVPRVNRQRRQICGQMPSLSRTELASARPAQSAEAAPVQITVDAPTATRAPQPARVQASARPAPATAVRRPAPAAVVQRPAPAPVVARAPAPTTRTVAPVAAAPAPVAARPAPQPAPVAQVSPSTRVVPRQVYDSRLQQRDVMTIPDGYRPVWTDDRLNPRRAEQSLRGMAQTRLVWTNTVPRRLIDQTTGSDVTAKVALVYPYTDVATQTRDLGTVTLIRRDGQLLKRIKRNRAKARTAVSQPAAKPTAVARQHSAVRPAPAPKPKAAPTPSAGGKYVQVGTFGVPTNAQNTARRLVSAGLPARIGTMTRGGKSYQIVLAGPFSSPNGLNSGLRTARAMGFSDAFVR